MIYWIADTSHFCLAADEDISPWLICHDFAVRTEYPHTPVYTKFKLELIEKKVIAYLYFYQRKKYIFF